jgi:hypothetical protein
MHDLVADFIVTKCKVNGNGYYDGIQKILFLHEAYRYLVEQRLKDQETQTEQKDESANMHQDLHDLFLKKISL